MILKLKEISLEKKPNLLFNYEAINGRFTQMNLYYHSPKRDPD